MPNLGSPRIRAAMRVLGVDSKELRKRDAESFGGSQGKADLFEQKRRNLIHEITALAAAPPAHTLKKSIEATNSNSTFLDEVLRREKANAEQMQKMAQKDIQKIVIQELEIKLQEYEAKKKQQESEQRLKEMRKAEAEKLRQAKKEDEKKLAKYAEVRDKAKALVVAESRKLQDSLSQADQRVLSKLKALEDARMEQKEKSKERFAEVASYMDNFEKTLTKQREQAYSEIVSKHDAKMEKLAEALTARQVSTEGLLQRQHESLDRVKTHQDQRQEEIESKYLQMVARHEKAKQAREESTATFTKSFKSKNTKAKTAHDDRLQKLQNEWEAHAKETTLNLKKSMSDSTLGSPQDRERESVVQARQMHSSFVEIGQQNRERLHRAHHYAVEQQLGKLTGMRERVQLMMDSKKEAELRRTIVRAESALEKEHLSHKVDRVRDCGPKKIVGMLGNLEVEPEAARRINEIVGILGFQGIGGVKDEEDGEKK